MITPVELWAKLERDEDGSIVHWHSLVDHSADVAAVMIALLDQPCIAVRLARLAAVPALCRVTRTRLGALAFLHDVGKANRGFRARAEGGPAVGHIDQVAWMFTYHAQREDLDKRFDEVLGLERVFGWEAADLLAAVYAHHGRPWNREVSAFVHWRKKPGSDPVADLAPMRIALDSWFPGAFEDGPALPSAPAFHHAFAGLLMLADWVGSDTEHFPFADGACADRMAYARVKARNALDQIGLAALPKATRKRAATLSFTDLFANRPRPLQQVVTEPDALCIVLEAETGAGKTEAALWRFKHLMQRGEVDGLYFALPTRVAATAIFERIKAFRDRVFPTDPPLVVLAVPGQAGADGARGHRLADFSFEWDDQPDSGAARARWAAEHPKRFLAGRIAVGTIDQALLGAVRTRHSQMRGACLLRHLLVVDEVHASDRYMDALLRVLLRNHTGAGGHALLLSATLGSVARSRLLGTPPRSLGAAQAAPYPLLSWAADGREQTRAVPQSGVGKQVLLQTAPLLDAPGDIARLALNAAACGARVLIIRNTVGAAIASARALEAACGAEDPRLFRVSGRPTVHHGRFAAADRTLLDAEVEAAMGRCAAPGGRVVVGTQTLEISLDLDADLLLTDLCPADVLLQRIGRLHRHADRIRPKGFTSARAVVLVPKSRDLLRLVRRNGGRHGMGQVYEDIRGIEATWREIELEPLWNLPAMNRTLVERTTHPTALDRIEKELDASGEAGWTRHGSELEGELAARLGAASSAALCWTTPFADFRLDADERITTRLGNADRLVQTPPELIGPFGNHPGALRIRYHMLPDGEVDAEPTGWSQADGAIRFAIGQNSYVYSRMGLSQTRAA